MCILVNASCKCTEDLWLLASLILCMCVHVHVFMFMSSLLLYLWFHSGLKIVEVAHDNQTQVTKYIKEDLDLLNSYDTCHGEL